MIHGALDHLDHVIDLRGVGARDECGPSADELFHRVDRLIDRAGRVGLALETDGRRRRGLLFGQAIDEVVHDEVGEVDVLARAVSEMVPPMEKPSPSPPKRKTCRAGRARLMPLASGTARPWMKWA